MHGGHDRTDKDGVMEFQLREAQPADLSRCLLDTLGSLAEVHLTPQQALEIFQERQRAGAHTYIAWDPAESEVVGTITLLLERKFIHHGGRVGHIEDVAVRRG